MLRSLPLALSHLHPTYKEAIVFKQGFDYGNSPIFAWIIAVVLVVLIVVFG